MIFRVSKQVELSRRNIWIGWLITFLIKLLTTFLFFQLLVAQKPDRQIGNFSFASGDNNSYIGAMENYISQGKYYFINQSGDTVNAGRPPHFTLPYWIARQFTNEENSADFLTFSSVLIESFAILCMALIAAGVCNNGKKPFYTALILGILSFYVSNWSFLTLPDAPGASLYIIGFYFYSLAFDKPKRRNPNIFLASFFFSWAIMLRPFIIVMAAGMTLIFLFKVRGSIRDYAKMAIAAVLPMIIIVGPWLFRNYNVTGKIVPFQQDIYAGYGYKATELASRRLITAIGEDGGTFWDPTAMASYFSPKHYKTSTFVYPSHLRMDSTYIKEIEALKNIYIKTFDTRSAEEENNLVNQMAHLRQEYKAHHKLHFYLINPFRRMMKFWGHSGSYYISSSNTSFSYLVKTAKIIQSMLYYAVLILGTIGLCLLSRTNILGWALLLPIIILTVFFPVLNGFMEPRYALAFYFPGIIGLIYFVESFRQRLVKRNPATSS